MTIGRKLAVGFGVAVVFLVAVGLVAFVGTSRLVATGHAVTHAHDVLQGIETVVSQLKDAETGQRGFLLTGKEEYLEPFDSAVRELPRTLKTLHDRTAEQPAQQRRPRRWMGEALADAAQASAQIVASAGQQATGMTQISQAMKNLDQVARQNLVATRQVEQAASNLNSLGTQLASLTAG